MSQSLPNSLQLQPSKTEKIHLSAFASQTRSPQHLKTVQIYKAGTKLPLSVLTVLPLFRMLAIQSQVTQLPYLQGLTLVHLVSTEKEFGLSLLIGAEYYWYIIEDHII